MTNLNTKIDSYLADGCGRCKLFSTPQCKVKNWENELKIVRQIVLETNLNETLKWSMPVYTYNDKNIVMISAFKSFCSLNFFKGVLLNDDHKILEKQGESSQSSRIFKITDLKQLIEMSHILRSYIFEAIEIEKRGEKVAFNPKLEVSPIELLQKFVEFPDFKTSFDALTAGRQRAYIIYFSQPKQSKSILSRIEKCFDKICKGEGLNELYKKRKN